jgi:hypothetical protein
MPESRRPVCGASIIDEGVDAFAVPRAAVIAANCCCISSIRFSSSSCRSNMSSLDILRTSPSSSLVCDCTSEKISKAKAAKHDQQVLPYAFVFGSALGILKRLRGGGKLSGKRIGDLINPRRYCVYMALHLNNM